MKDGWNVKKLGEVCEVLNGLWIGKKEPFINICVIRNTNFTKDCKLNLDNVAYIDAEVKQFITRKLKVGDIIIEKSGGSDKQPVGRVVLFEIESGDYSFSNFTSALRIKPDIELFPNYLHKCLYAYYLRGETFRLQSKTTGLHNLDMKGYLRLPITIPPIPEQSRIVEELDQLSNIIEKKRQQLSELDNLAQSIFYDMFGDPVVNEKGWEVKKLGEVCKSDLGKTLNQSKDKGEYHHYLCAINILWGYINLNNLKQARFESVELEKYSVRKGDLLICEGGDVGRAAIWNEDKPMLYQNALHRVRFDKSILAIYALYWLQWLKNNGELDKYVKGVTIKHLVKSSLLSIPICIPPIALQQLFAQKIEAIESEKALIKQSIAETEELFNSRMDDYFG